MAAPDPVSSRQKRQLQKDVENVAASAPTDPVPAKRRRQTTGIKKLSAVISIRPPADTAVKAEDPTEDFSYQFGCTLETLEGQAEDALLRLAEDILRSYTTAVTPPRSPSPPPVHQPSSASPLPPPRSPTPPPACPSSSSDGLPPASPPLPPNTCSNSLTLKLSPSSPCTHHPPGQSPQHQFFDSIPVEGPHLSPSVSSHSISNEPHDSPVVAVPAEEFQQLVESVNHMSQRISQLEEWQLRVEKVFNGYKPGPNAAVTNRAEIQSRLHSTTTPSGTQKLCIRDDFLQSMTPFVPNHKDIARRLVNGLFTEAERVGSNVRGVKGEEMDRERIEAVYNGVFQLCPAREGEKKDIWQRCVTAINDQNRNIERKMKKLFNP